VVIEDRRYCNFCHGIIVFGQKHVQFRVPGSDGKSQFDFIHYHYRFKGDCWDRQARNPHQHSGEQPLAQEPLTQQ
jgi:hypothetical protein